jgi:3-oxosteroid 1-dehydrogenase
LEALDEVFDFIVVGSGGGSMCASLVMRSAGKSVVILEKTGLVGGTTARSGGVMWIPNNRFMAEDGVEDSFEKAMAYMDATAGQSENAPGASPERRRAYVVQAPRMVDFLVGQGIKLRRIKWYPDYHVERPGGSASGRTVVAELFDATELGAWRTRLQPNFLQGIPARMEELNLLPYIGRSWAAKFMAAKIGVRAILGRLAGKHWVTNGAALQGRMLKAALAAGVDVRTEAKVKSLIVEDGAVKGVVLTQDGRDRRLGASLGVLVNAGGFAHNQAMRDQYIPSTSAKWTATTSGDTGEMIQEMMRIGAAVAQMNEIAGQQMAIPPGRENKGDGVDLKSIGGQTAIAKPHSIIVDQSGVRYMREAGSYHQFCRDMIKRNKEVPAIPSWWIVDERYMQSYMYCGAMAGMPKPKEWYDSGFLKRADTIEALATLCGVEPATLKATVDRFNDLVRGGRDEDFHRGESAYDTYLGDPFHKPSASLGTIEHGPFYAAPVVPGDIGTWGGVVTDDNARVLREDGAPIPGLYATGISTASAMGRFYPGAGASVGPSFVWGFVAANHAVEQGRA